MTCRGRGRPQNWRPLRMRRDFGCPMMLRSGVYARGIPLILKPSSGDLREHYAKAGADGRVQRRGHGLIRTGA